MFLRAFGSNQYDIPVLYESGVDNPFGECVLPENQQHYIPNFQFVSQTGEEVGRDQMEGKVTIVDFFFTSCPSICPVMSTEMTRVQDVFRNDDRVQIYSISIDPDYDSPEVMAEYADRHDAKPDKWFFLHGDKEEVFNLARCGFVLPIMDGMGDPDEYAHSDKFALVDEQGRIRGYYSGTTRDQVDLLILETKILLDGNK